MYTRCKDFHGCYDEKIPDWVQSSAHPSSLPKTDTFCPSGRLGIISKKLIQSFKTSEQFKSRMLMKSFPRFITTLFLTSIYLVISLSPLASFALRCPAIAHAVTGECVGNCDICGCSPERRANHTCCCFLKKKQQHERESVPACCKKKKHSKISILTCNCPCGGNKIPCIPGAENTEILPSRFSDGIIALAEGTLLSTHKKRLTNRHGDPPDPPP